MQTTIGKAVEVSGVGLHSGKKASLRLVPAPEDTGIIFRRVDLQNFEIPAQRRHVSRVVLATTLMRRGVMLSTVEHLMSALYGLGIDNIFLEIDSLELPILDGSAKPFADLIEEAGIVIQNRERVFLKVTEAITLRDGDKFISIEPGDEFKVHYGIDFAHPLIGRQSIELVVDAESYSRELAWARTFGFLSEVEQLRKSNLIRGGSPENAIVLSEDGIYEGELRAPDEFVRHKALDLIGDIALCGYPLLGIVKAFKAGHALHTDLATQIVRDQSRFVRVAESALKQAV